MKKFNPILVVVFVAAAVAILGYAYTVFSNRYGHKTVVDGSTNANKNSLIDEFGGYFSGSNNNEANENQNANLNANENQNTNANANSNTNAAESEAVSSKDCNNGCSRFENDDAKYKYCREVCGYVPVSKKNSDQDCANLSGLDKDYCWRDLAVSKKDSSICSKIGDKKLQSVCRNRVTEELLN